MKKLLTIAIATSFLFSCSKDDSLQKDPPEPILEFKLDGSLKTYTKINAAKVTGTKTMYSIVSVRANEAENYFSIGVFTDSLKPGDYVIKPDNIVLFREGQVVANNMTGPGLVLHVEGNVGGLINGSFTGTLYNGSTSYQLTGGKFSDIQMIFQ